jgi:hypothetical protein
LAAARETFFRSWPADADPEELLDPDRQVTEPWGSHDHGPCDKCDGNGRAAYECSSCLVAGARADCPSCEGRVHFVGVCPACLGDGIIDDTVRHGVAVFPSREGLYRYLALKGAPGVEEKVLLGLEGELSEEIDLDADLGSLLIVPTGVVSVEPLRREAIL